MPWNKSKIERTNKNISLTSKLLSRREDGIVGVSGTGATSAGGSYLMDIY